MHFFFPGTADTSKFQRYLSIAIVSGEHVAEIASASERPIH